MPVYCPACMAGKTPYDQPHQLVSSHGDGAAAKVNDKRVEVGRKWNAVSESYRLPWETNKVEKWRIKAQEDEERIEKFILGEVSELSVQ